MFGSWGKSLEPEIDSIWEPKEDLTNGNIILKERREEEEVSFEYIFVNPPPSLRGRFIITMKELFAYYKLWIDPWKKQKAWAKKYGYTWKEEMPESVPCLDIDVSKMVK